MEFVLCWKPEIGVLSEFPNIKVIQSVGASVEHITNTQNLNNSITLSRIVDENLSLDMFEFILSSILLRIKNFNCYFYNKENKIWLQKKYQSVNETRLTIVGLGKIGGYVAERLANLGFAVRGWSNSKKALMEWKALMVKKDLKNP